ncbi:MAG TPA: response regulator [Aeromonadales bacterium]|nr:response regulator [Aeromonadales bacterium]
MDKILLIDDDKSLAKLLQEYLEGEGLNVTLAYDLKQGLDIFPDKDFDLIILDVMLPDGNGFDIIPKIRKQSWTPILMLTARGDEVDRIIGLELGADDYLAKPCSPRELFARIKALLRRSRIQALETNQNIFENGRLKLIINTREVFSNKKIMVLTGTEFNLLLELMKQTAQLVTRDFLSQQVLGRRLTAFDRSIDMHISNLRKKLHLGQDNLPDIKTVRGAGYILTKIEEVPDA